MGGIWRERWSKLLLQTLMLAGPAFMKWGQWAAARPDLFPEDIARELEVLHMVTSFFYISQGGFPFHY
jgi:aarF domain-containing kinase